MTRPDDGRRRARPARSGRSGLVVALVAAAIAGGVGVAYVMRQPPRAGRGGAAAEGAGRETGAAAEARVGEPAPRPVAGEAASGGERAADLAPAEELFGPHVRDVAVVDGGALAVLGTMNWDHNLYGVDTKTGEVRWRRRVGHYFAFEPVALERGFAVQGFDMKSAEGYHLYLAGPDGGLERRFALYGIPRRLPHRFVPGIVRDRANAFAVPPDGAWVASAGDLGLAVWDRSGRLLWSDDWWKDRRRSATLGAADSRTLLVTEGDGGMTVAGRSARDGKELWRLDLAPTGEVTRIVPGPDGATVALVTTADGGKVYVLRAGKLVRAFVTAATDAALGPDGSTLAVTDANQLKLYSLAKGLQWTFGGDDRMRFPRFSADGRRIACASDLGSVYVLDMGGRVLFEEDTGARTVPAWLPGGALLLAGWMGDVRGLDAELKEVWRTKLAPEAEDMTGGLLADDGAPTSRVASWSNAEKEPSPISPNLLAGRQLMTRFVPSGSWGGRAELAHDPAPLYDGKADPPPSPWVAWNFVGFFAETSPVNYLLIDTFRTRLRVEAVTFFEDPDHPESWLRDVDFERWDAAAEEWVRVKTLLSDAAVHTHRLDEPVEAARFRVLFPWGVVGSFRLGEVVFHGEEVGNSHPDVAAKRATAVLFDEHDDIKTSMIHSNNGLSFKLEGAHSGGRCFALRGDAGAAPLWQPPFGHVIANWDFDIVPAPQPGQYRWLSFAWKAASAGTRGITLGLRGPGGGAMFCVGEPRRFSDTDPAVTRLPGPPPAEWRVECVDLLEAAKRPFRVQALSLGTVGDGALVDRIVLGRTREDLTAPGGRDR